MILLARALVRLVSFVLLVVLALAGLALAVFCISTGTTRPEPWRPGRRAQPRVAARHGRRVARTARGPRIGRRHRRGVRAGGDAPRASLLLAGDPRAPPRAPRDLGQRRAVACWRRGAVRSARAATALVEQVRGVTEARVRVRPRRRAGGRLTVRTSRTRAADPDQVQGAVRASSCARLTDPFKLKARVAVPRRGARVE